MAGSELHGRRVNGRGRAGGLEAIGTVLLQSTLIHGTGGTRGTIHVGSVLQSTMSHGAGAPATCADGATGVLVLQRETSTTSRGVLLVGPSAWHPGGATAGLVLQRTTSGNIREVLLAGPSAWQGRGVQVLEVVRLLQRVLQSSAMRARGNPFDLRASAGWWSCCIIVRNAQ